MHSLKPKCLRDKSGLCVCTLCHMPSQRSWNSDDGKTQKAFEWARGRENDQIWIPESTGGEEPGLEGDKGQKESSIVNCSSSYWQATHPPKMEWLQAPWPPWRLGHKCFGATLPATAWGPGVRTSPSRTPDAQKWKVCCLRVSVRA